MTGDISVLDALTTFKERATLMPVLFVGHGSPMNAIETNDFSNYWNYLGKELEHPSAILVISAHWLTKGTRVTAMQSPETIHDFGGFPQALFDVQYPASGSPELALETKRLIKDTDVVLDHDWGLDHGTWSVVRKMYPQATIPVIQLSIDFYRDGAYHYHLAQQLKALRKRGVLIIGSGNLVHNLKRLDWKQMQSPNYGFDWALESNELFKQKVLQRDFKALVDYTNLGTAVQLAIPTPDHYYPLLYSLGLYDAKDEIQIFNDAYVGGSLSMTSFLIG